MNKKKSIPLEIMWLTIAIISIVLGIYKSIIIGFSDSIPYFVITLVSIIMYSLRKYIIKSSSKSEEKL